MKKDKIKVNQLNLYVAKRKEIIKKLVSAIKNNDIEKVNKVLKNFLNSNLSNDINNYSSILFYKDDEVSVIDVFQHPDIDINMTNQNNQGLLYIACYSRILTLAKVLLSNPRLNVNIQEKFFNYNSLHWACFHNDLEIVKLIISHPSFNIKNHIYIKNTVKYHKYLLPVHRIDVFAGYSDSHRISEDIKFHVAVQNKYNKVKGI